MEHQIVRFAKMILRDRCSTLYDLASIFLAGAILQRHGLEKSQNALARGRQLCTQLSIFEGSLPEFSFLMLSTSKNEEVSQNCFVFDVVNFENEEVSQNCFVFDVVNFENRGSLGELLRF